MTPLIQGLALQRQHATEHGVVHALRGVDVTLAPGEWLGVVGESGSGKSTLGRVLCGLETPTAGQVLWEGHALGSSAEDRRARARLVQPVFQDNAAALNPRRTVGESLREALSLTGNASLQPAQLLEQVGLDPAAQRAWPHTLSGGQRQRVGLARALAARPKALILDEPVSSLDASVAAHVLQLLMHLRTTLDLAAVFIAHDLSTVRRVCHRVAVMYLGRVVEEGPVETVLAHPQHPYTRALLEAAPSLDHPPPPALRGEPPSPITPPPGCAFHPRCPVAIARCAQDDPAPVRCGTGHLAACHLATPGT